MLFLFKVNSLGHIRDSRYILFETLISTFNIFIGLLLFFGGVVVLIYFTISQRSNTRMIQVCFKSLAGFCQQCF